MAFRRDSFAASVLPFVSTLCSASAFIFFGMGSWSPSDITALWMEWLVQRQLICAKTEAIEWLVPGSESEPCPPPRYVKSFTTFHERGLGVPAHRFFWGLLRYFGVELQHLNPNGIQHLAAFVGLCEGYLGVEPNITLWRYFFGVNLQHGNGGAQVPMGCAGIHLHSARSSEYIPIQLSSSNKGWHWSILGGRLPTSRIRVLKRAEERTRPAGRHPCCHPRSRRVLPLMARTLQLHALVRDRYVGPAADCGGGQGASSRGSHLRRRSFPSPGLPTDAPQSGVYETGERSSPHPFSLFLFGPRFLLISYFLVFFAAPSEPQAFPPLGA